MKLQESNQQLRYALDEITESLPRENHVARVARLRSTQTHGIDLASAPDLADIPPDKFTCFMHAFNLVDSAVVSEIAGTFKETYPNSDFVGYLVAHYLSEIPQQEACDGDVLIYSGGGEVTHAGKLKSERVISKWGTGYLWEHNVAEVPAKYGHDVRFYRAIPKSVAEEAFVAYARQREGADTINLLLGVQEG